MEQIDKMEFPTTLDEINGVVRWYKSLHIGYNNLNELMYNRMLLSNLLFTYTTEVGELRQNFNNCQAIYENKRNRLHFANLEQGVGKAELLSKLNTSKEFGVLKTAEGMYYKHKENIEAIKEVLSTMNQHIAIVRDELSRIHHAQNS